MTKHNNQTQEGEPLNSPPVASLAMLSSNQEPQGGNSSSRPTSASSSRAELDSAPRANLQRQTFTDWQSIVANSNPNTFNPLLNASLPAGLYDPVYSDLPPGTSFDLLQRGAIAVRPPAPLQSAPIQDSSRNHLQSHAHPTVSLGSYQSDRSATQFSSNTQYQNANLQSDSHYSAQNFALLDSSSAIKQSGDDLVSSNDDEHQNVSVIHADFDARAHSVKVQAGPYNPFSNPEVPFPLPEIKLKDLDENGNLAVGFQPESAADGSCRDPFINTPSGNKDIMLLDLQDPCDAGPPLGVLSDAGISTANEMGIPDNSQNISAASVTEVEHFSIAFYNSHGVDVRDFAYTSRDELNNVDNSEGNRDFTTVRERFGLTGRRTYVDFDFSTLSPEETISTDPDVVEVSNKRDEDYSKIFEGYNVFDYAGSPFGSGVAHTESFGDGLNYLSSFDEVHGDNDLENNHPRRPNQSINASSFDSAHHSSRRDGATGGDSAIDDGDGGLYGHGVFGLKGPKIEAAAEDLNMLDSNNPHCDPDGFNLSGGPEAIRDIVMGDRDNVSGDNSILNLAAAPNGLTGGGFGENIHSSNPTGLGADNYFEGFSGVCYDPPAHPNSRGDSASSRSSDATLVPLDRDAGISNKDEETFSDLEVEDADLADPYHRIIERAQRNLADNISMEDGADPNEVIRIHQNALNMLEGTRGMAFTGVDNTVASTLVPRQPIAPDFEELAISLMGKARQADDSKLPDNDLCAFCHFASDFGVLNELLLLPAEASPHFCIDCRASTSAFHSAFSDMDHSHVLDEEPCISPLTEALDNDEVREIARGYQRAVPRPHNTISQISGENIEQFQGILFCRGSPYRQIDLEKVKICGDCVKEKLEIIKHGHREFTPISSNGSNADGLVEISDHERLKNRRCMICLECATHKCEGCPLRVCDHCHTILTNICGNYLDNLFYFYNKKHLRNDAFLLRSDGGGF